MVMSSRGIKSGGGASRYYENLASEDYYANGGEPMGQWLGDKAAALGLEGKIEKGELAAIMSGYHPKTGEALTVRLGADHKPGEDLAFNAPKPVSLIWATASPELRQQISEAMRESVAETIKYAEQNGAFREQFGHAGVEKRAYDGGLIAAYYEHSTSREGDAHLHAHCLVQNCGTDGRNIDFDTSRKMELGAYQRAVFTTKLQEIGLKIERDRTSFRVVGVEREHERESSTRRAQIEKELRERGVHGGKAAAVAAIATRPDKGEVDREKLFAQVQIVAEQYGLTAEKIAELVEAGPGDLARLPDPEEIIKSAIAEHSTIDETHLRAAAYQAMQGAGLTPAEIEKHLEELKASPELIELQDSNGNARYTSKEMYDIEQRIWHGAKEMAEKNSHPVHPEALASAIDSRTLSEEQKNALAYLTAPAQIVIMEGVAGAGKTYTMDAAREVWQKSGYDVLGCAVAGNAAEGLQQDAKIQSDTIAKTLILMEQGKLLLGEKSVLVVEEAGMVGSRQMELLQSAAKDAGAKLVILGETKQLQPIDNGGAMRAQVDACGSKFFQMDEIRRQQSDEERAAKALLPNGAGAEERAMVMNARSGHVNKVFEHLEENGRVEVLGDRAELRKEMGNYVAEQLGEGKTAIALAETRAEVASINSHARAAAQDAGLVEKESHPFNSVVEREGEAPECETKQFAKGDRVIFLKNSDAVGVKNGTTGTVIAARDGHLTVQRDNGKIIKVDSSKYAAVAHGYASTVHKAQGVTVDRAAYAPGSMAHRQLAYVALSRHRGAGADGAKLFVTKEQWREKEALAKQMGRSLEKNTSAHYQKVDKYTSEVAKAQARVDAARKALASISGEAKTNINPKEKEQGNDRHQSGKLGSELGRTARAERLASGTDRAGAGRLAPDANGVRQPDNRGAEPGRSAQPADPVRELPGRDVVRRDERGERENRSEVPVQKPAHDDLGKKNAGRDSLRRPDRRADEARAAVTELAKAEKALAAAKAKQERAAAALGRAVAKDSGESKAGPQKTELRAKQPETKQEHAPERESLGLAARAEKLEKATEARQEAKQERAPEREPERENHHAKQEQEHGHTR